MKIDFSKIKERKLINFKRNEYDFIIIGSGPAAVVLYKKLISKQKNKPKILIVEEGDYIKHKYKKILSKFLPIKITSRVFSVGGSTNTWSNISSSFEEFEMLSRWKKKKINLWPLNHKALIYEYKKLKKEYGFSFNKLKKKKINIPFEIRPFIAPVQPINFKKLIDTKEVDLVYNCRIDTVDENKKTTFAYTNNKKIYFTSKKIIICCGGIESTILIKNSVSQKKLKKIKNKESIGKYFMDHPKFNLGYLKYPKLDIIKKLELKKNKFLFMYHGISLKKKIQLQHNLLNTYVRFEKLNHSISNFFYNIFDFKNLIQKKKYKYKIKVFCEMIPSVKNFISSKNGKNFIIYKLSKTDYKTIKLLSNQIMHFFSFKPNEETDLISNSKDIIKKIEDASHHMGGLIFDHNKNISVVDKNLKIIGLTRTYICSSAIFPSSGSVNPTMTICALSNRLGEHLLKKTF